MGRLVKDYAVVILILCGLIVTGGCSDGSDSGSGDNSPRSISGQVPAYAYTDQLFEVQFSTTGMSGTVTFAVDNAPDWLAVNVETGIFNGTPTEDDIGTYTSILISAVDENGNEVDFSIQELIVPEPPVIVRFDASRTLLLEGESAELNWFAQNVQYVALEPLDETLEPEGSFTVTPDATTDFALVVTSPEGHVIREFLTITVEPLVDVRIDVASTSGGAPFEVMLTPITKTQNAINRFYWDFEGDGGEVDGGLGVGESGFDYVTSILNNREVEYDATGRSQRYTYSEPGTYTPRLRIWDAEGNQTDTSQIITVTNEAPTVTVTVSRSNGEVPLSVNFSAEVSDNEGVSTLRWDFDGDGNVDQEGPETDVTNLYTQVGDFQPKILVEDVLGAVTEVALPHISIRARPVGSNSISVNASPLSGKAPLSVRFRGTSTVPSGSPVTSWQWDFDGDGNIDQETTSGNFTHIYESPGTFYPSIQLLTEDGQVARDIKEITVQPDVSLGIQQATFDPEAGQSATIDTQLSGTYQAQIDIVDQAGTVVRTVVPRTERASGSYSDSWDGKDDNGNILPPGSYFALLRYRVGANDAVLDLRQTTSGFLLYPGRCSRGIGNCGTLTIPNHRLEPFDNKPWIFEFTSNYIADYSAYMNIYTTNELVMTFFVRRPFGSGEPYDIVWNGEDTDGALLPKASTRYLINLMGETLGDNALFLNHGVKLSSFSASPSILYPNQRSGKLSFSLSRAASVEMWVTDAQVGGEVFRTSLGDFPAGDNQQANWAGKNFNGIFLAPGAYRISLRATDEYGYVSQDIHTMQRIDY